MTGEAPKNAALIELDAKKQRGEISDFEYNSAKRKLLEQNGFSVEPPSENTAASAPSSALKWGEQTPGIKLWDSSTRLDDPKARSVHAPTAKGVGDGKSFFFLFGFRLDNQKEQAYVKAEIEQIEDDIAVLRNCGYTVVVDTQATSTDLFEALYGKGEGVVGLLPAGIYWSAHGDANGGLQTCEGSYVQPQQIETSKVQRSIKLMIFGACYLGAHAGRWRKALADLPLVVGWGQPVTLDRAVQFLKDQSQTSTNLANLLQRYLVEDKPVPPAFNPQSVSLEAKTYGRVGDLESKLPELMVRLGASWKPNKNTISLFVPLPESRFQIVDVFLTDSCQPSSEGETLFSVETLVGELTAVVTLNELFAHLPPGYSRVTLVSQPESPTPVIAIQGFLPYQRISLQDMTTLVFEVATVADSLEKRIFGTNMR